MGDTLMYTYTHIMEHFTTIGEWDACDSPIIRDTIVRRQHVVRCDHQDILRIVPMLLMALG